MSKQYKCVKGFAVDKYDEHEMIIQNEQTVITEGSIWEKSDYSHMSDVRLEGITESSWLEITFDSLKEYFEEITAQSK